MAYTLSAEGWTMSEACQDADGNPVLLRWFPDIRAALDLVTVVQMAIGGSILEP